MTIAQIEENVSALASRIGRESFLYDLLLAYGTPPATIRRLQVGTLNQGKQPGQIIWKKKVWFEEHTDGNLYGHIEALRNEPKTAKQHPRFIIVTDYERLLAADTKTGDTLDIGLSELSGQFDFFLPLAGMEKQTYQSENPADVKAATQMARLYDQLHRDNPEYMQQETHAMNVFFSRLLFCFFAEDTGIFEKGQFSGTVASYTQEDGSDLSAFLDRLFDVLNQEKREGIPAYLHAFPYVNGGLFRIKLMLPTFTRKSRTILLACGSLDWSAINPDIFGSMIQAVVTPDHRSGLGMHYTSVPNIMKVIKPLFLDELHEALETTRGNLKKLNELHQRICRLKLFDPACGSGNFLIIAYKELRLLEMEIFKEIERVRKQSLMAFSGIKLSQFYGIELDDFAHEVAILSLWLAEHQMNTLFVKAFGRATPFLPLKDGGNIVQGNATRLIWEKVCPRQKVDEVYVMGNPPYLGGSLQSKEQKDDMAYVFSDVKGYKNLDYIACWFWKGAKYISGYKARLAFVTTNSISQGEQVGILWPEIFQQGVSIHFAYQSFKWSNNAKGNAGVTVAIIGMGAFNGRPKQIFERNNIHAVSHINAYLVDGPDIFVQKRYKPLSDLPLMDYGSKAVDGGNLSLNRYERDELLSDYPSAEKFIKKFTGANESINGIDRYCLWIEDEEAREAMAIPPVAQRIEKVRQMRAGSGKAATREEANFPYRFGECRYRKSHSTIVVPTHSSENRKYIPFGFLYGDWVVSNSAQVIYNSELWNFGVITSLMHMLWVKIVGGRLKTDYRYSSSLCYNTFPFPKITKAQKAELDEYAFGVIGQREYHPEKTLAELYDPDKMPDGLREAHHQLDLAVERCYRSKPFESDEERLAYLFKLYERMVK